jgi:O-antigen/teichoic acid export membrane protein
MAAAVAAHGLALVSLIPACNTRASSGAHLLARVRAVALRIHGRIPMTPSPAPADESAPTPNSLHQELQRAWRTSLQLGVSLACTWTVAMLVRFAVPRHLGPLGFGDLSLAETFTAGFFVFAGLGIDTYTMREVVSRPAHVSDYFAGVQLVRLVLSAVAMLLLLAVLVARDKPDTLIQAAELWAVTYGLMTLNGSLSTLLQGTGRTGRLAIGNVIAKIAWGSGLIVCLEYADRDWLWMYVLPALLSELFRTALIYPAAQKAVGLRWRIDAAATKAVLRRSLPYYLGGIAIALGGPLNFLALELIKSDERELGWYGATLSLAALAMIFSPLLEWILLPTLARARARSAERVDTILAYALEALLLASIPLALIGALGASVLVPLALGPAYAPSTTAFAVLAIMCVFTYAAMILANGLIARGHPWSLTSLSIVNVVAAPTLSWAIVPALHRWLGLGGEAAGAAIAMTLSEVMVVTLALLRLGRGILTPRLVRTTTKCLLACAVVVVIDRRLSELAELRLVIDLVCYVAIVLLVGAVNLRELRGLLRTARQTGGEPA